MCVKCLILLVTLLMVSTAMAGDIEEPEWELMETLGKVEIRHYAPSIQATTVIDSSAHTTAGFRRLAGYIFGGNERSQSIAMTAPVQETLAGGKPVMAFTMPSEYALDELPMPDDERIQIVTVPARTVAVVRFSGWATGPKVARMQQKLLDTLELHGIRSVGAPALNQYNPPWTAPFLRRNEVVVDVKWGGHLAVAR
jgi:hypothetical protein